MTLPSCSEFRDEIVKQLELAAEQQRIFATACSNTSTKKGFLRAASVLQQEADRIKKIEFCE